MNLDEIPKVVENFDDDTAEIREETGAAGGIQLIEDNNHENIDTSFRGRTIG